MNYFTQSAQHHRWQATWWKVRGHAHVRVHARAHTHTHTHTHKIHHTGHAPGNNRGHTESCTTLQSWQHSRQVKRELKDKQDNRRRTVSFGLLALLYVKGYMNSGCTEKCFACIKIPFLSLARLYISGKLIAPKRCFSFVKWTEILEHPGPYVAPGQCDLTEPLKPASVGGKGATLSVQCPRTYWKTHGKIRNCYWDLCPNSVS
jgi:hypothetical protein